MAESAKYIDIAGRSKSTSPASFSSIATIQMHTARDKDASRAWRTSSPGERPLSPEPHVMASPVGPHMAESSKGNTIVLSQLDEADIEAALRFPTFAHRERQTGLSECRGRSPVERPLLFYEPKANIRPRGNMVRTMSYAQEENSLDLDIFNFEDEPEEESASMSTPDADSESEADSDATSTRTEVADECPDCGNRASMPMAGPSSDIFAKLQEYKTGARQTNFDRRARQRSSADLAMIWDDDDEDIENQHCSAFKISESENTSRKSVGTSAAPKTSQSAVADLRRLDARTAGDWSKSKTSRRSMPKKRSLLALSTAAISVMAKGEANSASLSSCSWQPGVARAQDVDAMIKFASTTSRLDRRGSLVPPVWDERWCYHKPKALARTLPTTLQAQSYKDKSEHDVSMVRSQMVRRASIVRRRWSLNDAVQDKSRQAGEVQE